ncbi:MAG: tetratricopeptide repeat protein [Planctomycetes bacterium]|nr:tetratricopeptide repeat protein [Planctomycetota bacterium]
MKQSQNKLHILFIYLALALVTLAVFWQVHSFDFISRDDIDYVTANKNVTAGFTRDGITWAFTAGYASNWHPLTWLSHMADCQLFGLNAGMHHLTNAILHIINTLLLFAVFKRMTGALWASAFVAAAFAVHPLHVESVAWVSERKDVLSTMFWFLTMMAYVSYVKRPGAGRYLLVLLAFALGLMAKPMLVTLPFVLLLLDYWPLGRFKDIKKLIVEKIPLFILMIASSVTTFLVQRTAGAVVATRTIPLITRTANALIAYAKYIEKMFWPSGLTIFYPHPTGEVSMLHAVIAAAVLISISVWVFWKARYYKYLAVGWLWFIGTLVPVIGLVQVGDQALADRYTYIPLVGLFIIIAWGASDLLSKLRYKKIILAMSAAAIFSTLTVCTCSQLRHWRNTRTVFEHALNVTEDNYIAYFSLIKPLRQQGKIDQAIAYATEALRIVPNLPYAHNSLGVDLATIGKYDEAAIHFKKALEVQPDFADARCNLGYMLARQGKIDEAIENYKKALQIDPEHFESLNNGGMALLAKGRIDEALELFEKALRIKPNRYNVNLNMGLATMRLRRYDESAKHFEKASNIEPDRPEAYYYLSNVYYKQGKTELAAEMTRKASELAAKTQ